MNPIQVGLLGIGTVGSGTFKVLTRNQAEIRGRDLVSGLPKMVKITSEEVREALAEPIQYIIEAVRVTLERTHLIAT